MSTFLKKAALPLVCLTVFGLVSCRHTHKTTTSPNSSTQVNKPVPYAPSQNTKPVVSLQKNVPQPAPTSSAVSLVPPPLAFRHTSEAPASLKLKESQAVKVQNVSLPSKSETPTVTVASKAPVAPKATVAPKETVAPIVAVAPQATATVVHFYCVRKGDTLSTIAQELYGHADEWKELAKLNKISNPNVLITGAKLQYNVLVPVLEEKKEAVAVAPVVAPIVAQKKEPVLPLTTVDAQEDKDNLFPPLPKDAHEQLAKHTNPVPAPVPLKWEEPTTSRFSLGAYAGYGVMSGGYKQDGHSAVGRLALGVRVANYKALTLGLEGGVQSGNTLRLAQNARMLDITTGMPLQAVIKPTLDVLATSKVQMYHLPIYAVLKGGMAYRQMTLIGFTSASDGVKRVNGELQAGLAVNVTPQASLTALYQSIYANADAGLDANPAGDVVISHIPTQQSLFVGFEYAF